MDLEQRLRESLVAPDPGAVFTARVMARVRRGRGRRTGVILIGTMLAVGAAAATLVWRMSAEPPPVEIVAVPMVSDPEPVVEEPDVLAATEVKEAVAAVPPAPAPPASTSTSPRFTVLVMPLRQESQDVAGRGPVEAFHAAMLDELRKVPGLVLQTPGESAGGGRADYVLTITSLASRASQSGGVVVSSTDGDTTYAVNGGGVTTFTSDGSGGRTGTNGSRTLTLIDGKALSVASNLDNASDLASVWAETMVQPRQGAVSRFTVSIGAEGTPGQPCNVIDRIAEPQVSITPNGATYGSGAMAGEVNLVLNRQLTGINVGMDIEYGNAVGSVATVESEPARPDVQPDRRGVPECKTPAQLAAAQVETLRLQVFPPDPAFQQQLVAQLGETSRDQAGQLKALQLLQMMARDGGSRLDDGTLQAIVGYAATQPAQVRASVWATLRFANVSSTALVAPLVETLRHDPAQQVRLVVLAHLEASYSSDPLARSALASIGREDADPIVRVAARRALYGQAGWREEILAALIDTSQPYEARLAPLIVNTPILPPRQQELRRAALQEQQVLLPLVNLIRERGQDPAHAQATNQVLVLLVGVEEPAVFDLFMQLLRETSALQREKTVERDGKMINMSGPVSYWVMEHRDDPRVLGILSDVDPQLRTMMELGNTAAPLSAAPVGPAVDLDLVPSNLLERMREVTKQTVPPAPPAQ